MFHTIKYKHGWLHFSYLNRTERIEAQYYVDGVMQVRSCRSAHAAKCLLTRQAKQA
jgi:hypothetical protein